MASSVARRSTTRIKYCGWMGSRSGLSSAAMSSFHFFFSPWAFSRNLRSSLRCKSGMSAFRVSFVSPTRPASSGMRLPSRMGSISICTALRSGGSHRM